MSTNLTVVMTDEYIVIIEYSINKIHSILYFYTYNNIILRTYIMFVIKP